MPGWARSHIDPAATRTAPSTMPANGFTNVVSTAATIGPIVKMSSSSVDSIE